MKNKKFLIAMTAFLFSVSMASAEELVISTENGQPEVVYAESENINNEISVQDEILEEEVLKDDLESEWIELQKEPRSFFSAWLWWFKANLFGNPVEKMEENLRKIQDIKLKVEKWEIDWEKAAEKIENVQDKIEKNQWKIDNFLKESADKKWEFLKRISIIEEKKSKLLEKIDEKIPAEKKAKILERRNKYLKRLEGKEDFIKIKKAREEKFQERKKEIFKKIKERPEFKKAIEERKNILEKRKNFKKDLKNKIEEKIEETWLERIQENIKKFRKESREEFKNIRDDFKKEVKWEFDKIKENR